MSDTRNHTTRDQLAEAIRTEIFYGGLDEDSAEYARMADALLASDAIAAVRAAAVAETTATIEAVAQTIANAAAEPVENFTPNAWRQLLYMAAHDVRAALSGGRTALDTALAQAWDDAWADGMATAAAWMRNEIVPPTPNPYRADTGADQ